MRPNLRLHARRLAAVLLLSLAVTGCGGSNPNDDGDPFNDSGIEGTVKLDERPSMETILEQYRLFQRDLFGELEQHFGPQHWAPLHGETGISGAGCNNDLPSDWGVVGLPTMAFDGTYPASAWQQVRDLVIEVGKKHGFTEITPLADQPGNLDFAGHDLRYGGTYEFGMGKNTVLLIETGCHRWDKVPPPPTPPPALP